ncbi:MAG TPA: nucleotidyltransferase domain-containing protein [Patescibacteria group bacterium]|nr:nucleotidyltransferase domain-containing protein [Patescibacteria group bacterium]
MRPLTESHIEAFTYGSIARGDVSEGSDIDIFIPKPPIHAMLEALFERAGITSTHRELVQATPTYAAKGYIHIDENKSYSFPLVSLRTVEMEFYRFAGSVTTSQLNENERVPGVDKRLMLIEPTEHGHTEAPVTGREGVVAKKLGIGVTSVLDRVRTLRRRERVGRTGVYIKRILAPDEDFGELYQRLARRRPPLRRRMRT